MDWLIMTYTMIMSNEIIFIVNDDDNIFYICRCVTDRVV